MLTQTLPQTYDEMIAAMLRCEQTKGQSVYQHGLSVSRHIQEILDHLRDGVELQGWKVPDWLTTYGPQILANLYDDHLIHKYALLHDCGKPYCRVEDEKGVHFPDHACVSAQVYHSAVQGTGDVDEHEIIGDLILWDMVIHTATAEEIVRYYTDEYSWTVKDACTLLIAALAEIHSNAKLFGGIESTSFKAKWKKIDRRGWQICKHYFG